MKTRAAFCGGKKKSTLFSSVVSKKRCFKKCFHCVFSAENVINIYTFRTSSIYTHCRYARASSSFSLSAVVRANDVQEEEEHSSSLSFFLSFFTHTRACINSSQ